MIRVVVVDDEIWVCQLIKNIVDWNAMGFEIVEEAYDGENGLKAILKYCPELVLTDIRMPGMDGIQLMQRTREEKLDTRFIVISGYNDFAYAQNALKYGALGYLLKPIDQDELTDFLLSIRNSLFEDQLAEHKKREMEGMLSDSIEQLRIQYFTDCLQRRQELQSLDKINQEYRCSFQPGCFQAVVGAVDERIESADRESLGGTDRDAVFRRAKEKLHNHCFEYVCLDINGFDVFILNYPETAKESVRRELRAVIDKDAGGRIREYDVTMAAGFIVMDLHEIADSYDVAVNGIQARIRYGTNQVIDLGQKVYKGAAISKVFSVEQEKSLILYMETFDCMSARTLMKEILQSIRDDDMQNPELIFRMSEEILELLYKAMARKGIEVEAVLGERDVWITKISRLCKVERIVALLNKALVKLKKYCEDNNLNKNQRAVELVKAYIAEHYRDDVTLKEAADLVYLNPRYLGELFKKETGLHFSEYLLGYRMDLAKEMLLDVRCRVGEVGDLVGYQDAKYFSKLFKKYVGVTPKQYKKMFS